MSHLLTVFRVSEDNHGDMDVAILQALLKGRNMISIKYLISHWILLLVHNTALTARPVIRKYNVAFQKTKLWCQMRKDQKPTLLGAFFDLAIAFLYREIRKAMVNLFRNL